MSILPTTKREPIKDLSRQIILVYGEPKIGKSSFAAQFPDALFFATEEGLKHQHVYEVPVGSWSTFIKAVEELERGNGQFKTIAIDTIDNLFKFCQDDIYEHFNINHESDLDWGKGWKMVEAEFSRWMTRVSKLTGKGLMLISHSEQREIKKKDKSDSEFKSANTLPNKARQIVLGMADMILYMKVDEKGRRVICTKPTPDYEAGDRSGQLPPMVGMGESAAEGYENFVRAYYAGDAPPEQADKAARKEVIGYIEKGLAYLAENKIDGFEVEKRRVNSLKKHLGVPTVAKINGKVSLAQLQKYIHDLRQKGRDAKNGNSKGDTK